jgi:hypothetical protein
MFHKCQNRWKEPFLSIFIQKLSKKFQSILRFCVKGLEFNLPINPNLKQSNSCVCELNI